MNCEVGGLAVHLSITDDDSGHEEGVLVGNGGGFCTTSEVDLAVVVTESNTSNNEGHSTRNLRLLGLYAGNSIGRSNNLGDVENVEIIQPTGVPSTKDDQSGLIGVIDHGGVLTHWGLVFALGSNGSPLHLI
jgi:hypothetical protein